MPNLTALVGLLIGLVLFFVDAALGVKLIGAYLLITGILRLLSPENATVLPRAPRRAMAAPPEDDLDDPDEGKPVSSNPADAYRTFTPEELATPRRKTKTRRRPAEAVTEEEDDEE